MHSWEETKVTMRTVLGSDWEKKLSLQSDGLIGSGCVAQVYKGKLLNDDTGESSEVAVKVLHPGVRECMHVDLLLMRSVAQTAEQVGEALIRFLYCHKDGTIDIADVETYPLRCVSLLESVDEFSDFMLSQLDLRMEAQALQRLKYAIIYTKYL